MTSRRGDDYIEWSGREGRDAAVEIIEHTMSAIRGWQKTDGGANWSWSDVFDGATTDIERLREQLVRIQLEQAEVSARHMATQCDDIEQLRKLISSTGNEPEC